MHTHLHRRTRIAFLCAAFACFAGTGETRAQYDPPASYYSSINSQTGSALQSQLRTIVSNMTGVNYGDARFSAPTTDADPNAPGNILLIYNRASVSGTWDGGATWNREHVWPDSRLGAGNNDPSNTYVGPASDQFNLRPCNPSINSSRSNTPYGPDNGTGANGYQGGLYYPGNADAGDVARGLFYMATRYSTLSLVDSSSPTGTQMGDLSALLRFHYRDVPDAFERRRNHAIYGLAGENSPAISNSYRQQNRNPYVDRPEYAWSVFADQQNDTQLSVGAADANGGSSANVNLGRVLRNAPLPAPQNVTLNKAGVDGTYYSVSTTGAATSSVTGRYNAFAMDSAGSRTMSVGLNSSTATAGLKSGSVVIDNLDVTTQGGAGRGANDANDVVNVSLSVLDPSNPSFDTTDTDALLIDFGSVQAGAPSAPTNFSIHNLASSLGASLTAGLDLDSIVPSGDTGRFTLNLGSFTNLAATTSQAGSVIFDTTMPGSFSATYTLHLSDENLPGTIQTSELTLNVIGTVVPEPTSLLGVCVVGLLLRRSRAR